jgi:pimeloyl-ACP methyl ester carboxylesterase
VNKEKTRIGMRSGYAPVNGLKLYYEIHGAPNESCPPLLLLHGVGDTIQTSFGVILPALVRNREVIAFEQQGYGHTADIPDRPFSFEQSAKDAVALLDCLKIRKADLFGFSNGGTIALEVAIEHPQVARKLIVASGFFSRDGADPAFWNGFQTATLGVMPKELRDACVEVAPNPENLQSMFEKAVERMRNFKDMPEDRIRSITAPTLVVCGDSDVMRAEHAVEEFRLLPRAQLAVLPGTDHMKVTARTAWLVPMIEEFLDAK